MSYTYLTTETQRIQYLTKPTGDNEINAYMNKQINSINLIERLKKLLILSSLL